MPAGVQPGADGMADHHREKRESEKRRGGRQTEEEGETDTYPWQCFLFMEGILGFDGRLSGTVGEECATCNRGRQYINPIRIIYIKIRIKQT